MFDHFSITFGIFLNLVSTILLAATAFIYFVLPQTKDVESKCTFHLMLTLSLVHMTLVYNVISTVKEILFNSCIIDIYVLQYIWLTMFSWSTVLSYHMWSRFRKNPRFDESRLMTRYLIFGYGIPAVLVLLCNIHIHGSSLYNTNAIEWNCWIHLLVAVFLYSIIPVIISVFANAFFFIGLQRRLWSLKPSNLRGQTSSLIKKTQFRLILNSKLFIVMGLPWSVRLLAFILYNFYRFEILEMVESFMILVISAEGIFIFYIMVIDRKRVCRGLVDKFGITKWRPAADTEESVKSVCQDDIEVAERIQTDV